MGRSSMDEQAIRANIRALMASGTLPRDPHTRLASIRIGAALASEQCTACQEAGPHVSYTFHDGRAAVHLHAACDALWREERPLS
jgi:hypothetical protein